MPGLLQMTLPSGLQVFGGCFFSGRCEGFFSSAAEHFHFQLSEETISATLRHSGRYERAISQATWQAEIALNSLNPLKLQGTHSQRSVLELQSPTGRASLEQPLDLDCDSEREGLFLDALCVPSPRTREDAGSEPAGEVWSAPLNVIIDKVLCFPAPLKNAKVTFHLCRVFFFFSRKVWSLLMFHCFHAR